MVSESSDLRLKFNVLQGFRRYLAAKKEKHKKSRYIEGFYHRGLMRSSIMGFKMFCRIIDKEALREKLEEKLAIFEQDYIKRCFFY